MVGDQEAMSRHGEKTTPKLEGIGKLVADIQNWGTR